MFWILILEILENQITWNTCKDTAVVLLKCSRLFKKYINKAFHAPYWLQGFKKKKKDE